MVYYFGCFHSQRNSRTSAQWVMELKRNGLRLPRLLRAYNYSLILFNPFHRNPAAFNHCFTGGKSACGKNIYYKPDVCL